MSTTLWRKWDLANARHIYTDCDGCEYNECWDSTTKTHGVYCDSTFYPRCWDASIQNWKVDVPCCGGETVPGTCCGGVATTMPKYLIATVSGINSCENYWYYMDGFGNESYANSSVSNGVHILEWESSCVWVKRTPANGYGDFNVVWRATLNSSSTGCSSGYRKILMEIFGYCGGGRYSFSGYSSCLLRQSDPCHSLPTTIDESANHLCVNCKTNTPEYGNVWAGQVYLEVG